MNRLAVSERAEVLHALCEGMSMRACERVFKRPFRTVAKIVRDVGDWAEAFHASMTPVSCDRIQADELWAFVGENDRGSALTPHKDGRGVSWTFLAVDRTTKLIIAHHTGSRRAWDATKFFRKLDDRLAKDEHGNFLVRPTIATDGMKAYVDSFEKVFGTRADFGQYSKAYTNYDEKGEPLPGSRFAGATRIIRAGNPNLADITTWRVERENGMVRQTNRRFTRKTNGFSKLQEYHQRQLAIGIIYRNFCWVPRPSRPNDGSSNWIKQIPAAMAAGLADCVWTSEDMIGASDEFIAKRAAPTESAPSTANDRDHEKRFWVVHAPYHKKTKVHKPECSACNHGLGKRGGMSEKSFWYGFASLDDATAFAAENEPDDNEICKLCLGEYHTLGRYGRRL